MDINKEIKEMADMNTGVTFMMMGARLFLNARSDWDINIAIECIAKGLDYLPKEIKEETMVQNERQRLIDAIRNDPYIGKHEKCEI